MMEFEEENEVLLEPVSPSGHYLKTSALSLSIIAVLEFEVPMFDESTAISLLRDVFLPINSRFSSIMVLLLLAMAHLLFFPSITNS